MRMMMDGSLYDDGEKANRLLAVFLIGFAPTIPAFGIFMRRVAVS
jgi:hypothetical protein